MAPLRTDDMDGVKEALRLVQLDFEARYWDNPSAQVPALWMFDRAALGDGQLRHEATYNDNASKDSS